MKWMILATLGFLTACGSKVGLENRTISCDALAPILVSEADTTETLRQVLVHNQTYARECE